MYLLKTKNIFQLNLNFEDWQYYMYTLLFVVGNILFPWLVHTIPLGGLKFLPIYFFVLIGAYKFGWKVGLMTAVLSPLANHVLTGMPVSAMLPSIFVKGIAMALIAAFIASKTQKLSLAHIALVIIGYQTLGFIFEWALTGSLIRAFQDITIGYPGLLIQLFGGFILLYLLKDYGKQMHLN
jgi:hypothetical protein